MQIFISYHTPNRAIAASLKQALEQALPEAEIFFDQSNLRFGYNWQPALYNAINSSDAFVAIVGDRLGSWQAAEYYAAHDKKISNPDGYVLLPIIITDRSKGPVPNLPGLSQLHWIECSEPTAPDNLVKIIDALQENPDGEPAKPWILVNPYRGLMAMEEQDCDFFFGRESETEEVIKTVAACPHKVISLVGNSGVGKSSLVQAGVISSLKRQALPSGNPWPGNLSDSREWGYLTFRPADEPIRALASTFINLWFTDSTDPLKYRRVNEWTDHLMGNGNLAELLEATRDQFQERNLVSPQRIFLYVDQAEELYSRASDDQTIRLSQLLSQATASDEFVVLLSQRSDYYGDFQSNRTLFDCSEIVDVPPLKADELIRVLREPAAKLDVKFYPPELPEQLVDASREQLGALALLADLMVDVWDKMQQRGDEGVIRALEDAKLIDIEKALADRADRFLDEHIDERPIVEKLFVLRLVKIYEQGTPFRRRVYEKDCTEAEWQVLNSLCSPDWRLVVTGLENGQAFAEVAHDILLSKWPALRDWIGRERQFLLWRTDTDREFNRWLRTWLNQGSIPDGDAARREFNMRVFEHPDIEVGNRELLQGARLEDATETLARRADAIDTHLRLFIKLSQRVAESNRSEAELAVQDNTTSQQEPTRSPYHERLNVFISYSRTDMEVADALATALEDKGVNVSIDRHGIHGGEDWQARFGALIASADALVFLLTPDSINSTICRWELDEAIRGNKRIIPFLAKDLGGVNVPKPLQELNYVTARPEDGLNGFLRAVAHLNEALQVNIGWLREQIRLSTRAMEWDSASRSENRLLFGEDILSAKEWLANRPPDAPGLTEVVVEFIQASDIAGKDRLERERRKLEALRLRNRLLLAISFVSLIAAAFAIIRQFI